jgi:hypothetical protein
MAANARKAFNSNPHETHYHQETWIYDPAITPSFGFLYKDNPANPE